MGKAHFQSSWMVTYFKALMDKKNNLEEEPKKPHNNHIKETWVKARTISWEGISDKILSISHENIVGGPEWLAQSDFQESVAISL